MAEDNRGTNEPEELQGEGEAAAGDERSEGVPQADEPEAPQAPAEETPAAEAPADEAPAVEPQAAAPAEEDEIEEVDETPRVKPEIPGADLEVDIVRDDDLLDADSRWSEDGDEEA
jgi:small subunit ribosomal protein S9